MNLLCFFFCVCAASKRLPATRPDPSCAVIGGIRRHHNGILLIIALQLYPFEADAHFAPWIRSNRQLMLHFWEPTCTS